MCRTTAIASSRRHEPAATLREPARTITVEPLRLPAELPAVPEPAEPHEAPSAPAEPPREPSPAR